ncbi:MAG: hypothetical protein KAS99_02145 [Candidatus Omnitrophica bacterium]|nr:hypothetical protein [Candidatus Omnitrophota bacterium]
MNYMKSRLKAFKCVLGSYKRIGVYDLARFRVLSRCACMGHNILEELGWKRVTLNHQKSRVDHLLKLSESPWIKPKPIFVEPYLNRKDILPLICQERQNFWNYRRPDVVFMDSYSELTDQLFVHRKGWQFLANYTDIDHSNTFSQYFESYGLLELNELKKLYSSFFSMLRKVYGNIPIIYLHFPTTLDKRTKFQDRGQTIVEIVDSIAHKFEKLYSMKIPDQIVNNSFKDCSKQTLKDFPYHFNKQVYSYFAEKIRSLGIRAK